MVSGVNIQKESSDQYLHVVNNLVPSFPSLPRSLSLSPSLAPWHEKLRTLGTSLVFSGLGM